jgi:hypothetical protein
MSGMVPWENVKCWKHIMFDNSCVCSHHCPLILWLNFSLHCTQMFILWQLDNRHYWDFFGNLFPSFASTCMLDPFWVPIFQSWSVKIWQHCVPLSC